ncbi:uroporphyrinogen-III synthase, partial [archaeon]
MIRLAVLLSLFVANWPLLRSFRTVYKKISCRNALHSTKLHATRKLKVALTREGGANVKLARLLDDAFEIIELPCLMFEETSEARQLISGFATHDLILTTSPQSANLLIKYWHLAMKPRILVATVGTGTSKSLKAAGIEVVFESSQPLGSILAKELTCVWGRRVIYPTSLLADDSIPTSLRDRGFEVTRLNAYTTVEAPWTACMYKEAGMVDIVTLASPSTAHIWAEKVLVPHPPHTPSIALHIPSVSSHTPSYPSHSPFTSHTPSPYTSPSSPYTKPVVCIGPTTYAACVQRGYGCVYVAEGGAGGL